MRSTRRWGRLAARILLGSVALAVLLAAAACPYAGRYLIVDEPLVPADAIVVLAGARAERWLEAVDLYKEGIAPHVLLSPGIIDPAEISVRRMGVRYPPEVELARDAMIQLGVPTQAITTLPGSAGNTADEAAQTRPIALERGWRRLLVVTSQYHTRRSRFAFAREFAGSGIEVRIRATRHDQVVPDRWWRSRRDILFVISELQKLAAYRLGLSR